MGLRQEVGSISTCLTGFHLFVSMEGWVLMLTTQISGWHLLSVVERSMDSRGRLADRVLWVFIAGVNPKFMCLGGEPLLSPTDPHSGSEFPDCCLALISR